MIKKYLMLCAFVGLSGQVLGAFCPDLPDLRPIFLFYQKLFSTVSEKESNPLIDFLKQDNLLTKNYDDVAPDFLKDPKAQILLFIQLMDRYRSQALLKKDADTLKTFFNELVPVIESHSIVADNPTNTINFTALCHLRADIKKIALAKFKSLTKEQMQAFFAGFGDYILLNGIETIKSYIESDGGMLSPDFVFGDLLGLAILSVLLNDNISTELLYEAASADIHNTIGRCGTGEDFVSYYLFDDKEGNNRPLSDCWPQPRTPLMKYNTYE